jgi:hypothetical protein
MLNEDPSQRYAANLQGEIDGASLYRMSQTEKNPELAQVYARLGAVEEAHAEFWKRKMGAIGQRVPSLRPSFRTRALASLAPGLPFLLFAVGAIFPVPILCWLGCRR